LIPVILITGFLGSGKTTLLQRLLADPALADTAVLINEFGDVGLDHHLLERIDDTMVLLQSGCLCCTIRGELSDAIRRLHDQRDAGTVPPFRRLVIETTGLADPYPILSTIHADPVLRHHFTLGVVVTTIDAVNADGQLARQPETAKQIAAADHVVLTKTDIAEPGSLPALIDRVRRINPTATFWPTAAIDANALLSPRSTGVFWADSVSQPVTNDIRAFCLVFDEPLDWSVFGIWLTMLLHAHGTSVLRVKGMLNVAGSATPVAIHGVQHLTHPPTHMAAWPDNDRSSRLVFIVRDLDPALIERSLRAFGGVPESRAVAA